MTGGLLVKPLLWICSSKEDLLDMPTNVIADFGHGLYQAQLGEHPDIAKPLTGFGGASVLELVLDDRGGTFRVVYTVRFLRAIIVLHSFQKKSKRGIATPLQEIDLVCSRLKIAEVVYKKWLLQEGDAHE